MHSDGPASVLRIAAGSSLAVTPAARDTFAATPVSARSYSMFISLAMLHRKSTPATHHGVCNLRLRATID